MRKRREVNRRIPPALIQSLRFTYQNLKQSYPEEDILKILNEVNYIPTSIFSKKLGSLEAMVKYLHENLGMSFTQISKIINRNPKSIWATYKKAKQKLPKSLSPTNSYLIPLSIFRDRSLGVLQHIVKFLHEEINLTFHEIAEITKRDDRTIWTTYKNTKRK
jgi:hypothetical protein